MNVITMVNIVIERGQFHTQHRPKFFHFLLMLYHLSSNQMNYSFLITYIYLSISERLNISKEQLFIYIFHFISFKCDCCLYTYKYFVIKLCPKIDNYFFHMISSSLSIRSSTYGCIPLPFFIYVILNKHSFYNEF